MIRLPIFKKEIKASNYSPHKILNKAYIVNNEIINILKQKYNLKKVVNEDLNTFLININYANTDQYYPEMCKILHEKNIWYINNIKQLETTGAIQFSEKEKNLDCKYLYNNQSNFLYIDNIEIIDENFAAFLNQKFNHGIKILQAYYVVIEENILLIIYVNQSFIYEIVSLSQNGGDYLFEYLLEVKSGQNFEKIELAKYIFHILTSYGIQKLILKGNTIDIGNNIFITFHQIKNSLNQSVNIKNTKSENKQNIYQNKHSNSKSHSNYNFLDNHITNPSQQSNYLIKDELNNIDNNKEPLNVPQLEKSNNFNKQSSKKPIQNKTKIENDTNDISDRLKVLIFLALSQLYFEENKLEKVYLINPQWLEQYNYKGIKSLVDKKSNEIIQIFDLSYDLISISKIIPLFDYKKLKKCDTYMNSNIEVPFKVPLESLELQNKYIYLSKQFILLNEKIFILIQKYFGISKKNDEVYYTRKNAEGDLIIFKNYRIYNNNSQHQNNEQNLILFGNINKTENNYNIKYIFDYNNKSILEKELQIIMQYNIQDYIYNRTCINPQNKNDFFSPIFDENKLHFFKIKFLLYKNYLITINI